MSAHSHFCSFFVFFEDVRALPLQSNMYASLRVDQARPPRVKYALSAQPASHKADVLCDEPKKRQHSGFPLFHNLGRAAGWCG